MSATIAEPAAMTDRMTILEFVEEHAGDHVEYIDGKVVELPVPKHPHGKVAFKTALIVGGYIDGRELGHVTINDTFVKASTPKDPTRVRGADFYFISYARLPRGGNPEGDPWINPELVIEIKSPSDYWPGIRSKVKEYLANDVLVAVVIDPAKQTATVFTPAGETKLAATDMLELPDILPGFAVPVAKFFA